MCGAKTKYWRAFVVFLNLLEKISQNRLPFVFVARPSTWVVKNSLWVLMTEASSENILSAWWCQRGSNLRPMTRTVERKKFELSPFCCRIKRCLLGKGILRVCLRMTSLMQICRTSIRIQSNSNGFCLLFSQHFYFFSQNFDIQHAKLSSLCNTPHCANVHIACVLKGPLWDIVKITMIISSLASWLENLFANFNKVIAIQTSAHGVEAFWRDSQLFAR